MSNPSRFNYILLYVESWFNFVAKQSEQHVWKHVILLPTVAKYAAFLCGAISSDQSDQGISANWKVVSLQLNNLVNGCYKDALLKTVTIPTSSNAKGETLKSHFAEEKVERKNHFLKMMLKFLAK